jgi:hypothetical protein
MKIFPGRLFFLALITLSCKQPDIMKSGTYQYDHQFLKQHDQTMVELRDEQGTAKVILSGAYQGRVMTSTASGDRGNSYGWINYKLIESGDVRPHINPVGGEERFWLGPEGGQYSLYFDSGKEFILDNWQVPALIDTDTFQVSKVTSTAATFTKNATIKNYSGSTFDLNIERTITLLNKGDVETQLKTNLPAGIKFVAYSTVNKVTNAGSTDWKKESGLISIWLLGMFTPTDQTTVIIPFRPAVNSKELITTNYFGKIPAERLKIQDSVLFFTCDGKYRSKLGIAPSIALTVAGSFDFEKNVLTLIKCELNPDASYVNSKWEHQQDPYKGDAINSYNDGPVADGSQLGPFYELESSSHALELKAGEAGIYNQSTFHFEGDFLQLNGLAKKILGVDLNSLKK